MEAGFPPSADLAALFAAVGSALRCTRAELNAADAENANHGDHILQIFETAAAAASDLVAARPVFGSSNGGPGADELACQMEAVARQLHALADNGSAGVYARGLEQIAGQLRRYQVGLEDFLAYLRRAAGEADSGGNPGAEDARAGETLKALMSGLAGWNDVENGRPAGETPLDMGALLEFGMAYMQAKSRGGSRNEVIADAAASASPLRSRPHRYQSGKLVIAALLEAVRSTRS